MKDNRVCLQLPLEGQWLRFAQDGLHRYARTVGFSPALEEMCAGSVMEACEELARRADEAGVSAPLAIHLDYKGQSVVIDLEYDRRIPLNPHRTEDYEVPDVPDSAASGSEASNLPGAPDLDAPNMDVLWLHMIKRRMDRVHFMVRGPRRVLRMIKYRRDEGREKQAWVMTICPRLGKGAVLHLDDPGAEHPSAVLQATGRGVLRLSPSQTFVVRRMDGEASFHDIYMAHIDEIGLTSPAMLAALYKQMESMGLLWTPDQERKPSLFRRVLGAVLAFNLTIPHADRLVTAVNGFAGFMFGPLGLCLLLAAGLSGAVPLWEYGPRFAEVVTGLEGILFDRPLIILPVYVLMLVHVALHELAHGAACKHYGGQVPRMGVMFYLTSFMFYCDTTAAWNFPRRRHRVVVSLAGPLVSFAVLGAGLWAAGLFAGGNPFWEAAFVAFGLLNMFGLAMNFNPFIKMDAYYMLLDWTGIADLRKRSFRFLERKLFGWLGLGDDKALQGTARERRAFWWYGLLGGAVTLALFVVPFYRLSLMLGQGSASGGRFLFAALIVALVVLRLGNLAYAKIRSVRYRDYTLQ